MSIEQSSTTREENILLSVQVREVNGDRGHSKTKGKGALNEEERREEKCLYSRKKCSFK
jgi:hypothetical protein